MATSMARSSLRRASIFFRRGVGPTTNKKMRSLATAAHHDDVYEAEKWEKITFAGIAICTVLAVYNLAKGHHEYPQPPPYPYLHIRNTDFPWGPDSLFEHIKKKKKHSDH